jgi:hypothetical protein
MQFQGLESNPKKDELKTSGADPGCLSGIPEPTFFHPGSRVEKIPDPDPHKQFKHFEPKNKIRNVHPRSRIWIVVHPGSWIRISGPKKHRIPDPDPQHYLSK